MNKITKARLALSSLTIYRGILNDETVAKYINLLESVQGVDLRQLIDAYGEFFYSLVSNGTLSLPEYLTKKVMYDDNIFVRQAAGLKQTVAPELLCAAENDLCLLRQSLLTASEIKQAAADNFDCDDYDDDGNDASGNLLENLPQWHDSGFWDEGAGALCDFYKENGCGIYAQYGALRWGHGGLFGVDDPDPVRLDDLKGYDYERGVVVDNTLEFLEGSHANNMLLYGDRGTGKSSTVKAVCNEFRNRGLRIIEVPKDSIAEFSGITQKIAGLPLKFIIFIDDLSFASDDDNYAALKGVLEGGLSVRPANTLIYATSNRRHFVKESFAEREGDDVHAADAMQEKLSLADRFGITVTFSSPDQKLYLEIVERLAKERGLVISPDTLARGALQWALMYNGRSARTARQYVDWAQARLKSGRAFEI